MNIFGTIKEAFIWAFDEREDFYEIKEFFNLNDEFENIHDVVNMFNKTTLEKYLFEQSDVVKRGEKYIYFHDELSKASLY